MKDDGVVRNFETGATRSSAADRIDPEGFLSPIALERFCEYMHKHRAQADGSLRDSDNWQKGMPRETYIKGMWRHFLHLWQRHRGWTVVDPKASADIEEDLCSIIFNAQGYLHELVKARRTAPPIVSDEEFQRRVLESDMIPWTHRELVHYVTTTANPEGANGA